MFRNSPYLSVDHLPVSGGESHSGHYPGTQTCVRCSTGDTAADAGGDQVEVSVPGVLTRPQEPHLARVSVRQEQEDVMNTHPPLRLLTRDHLQQQC